MSQLAAQLNVLSGGFKADARRLGPRPSFLFTAAQAANVDADTAYALGANGLAELRALDERFAAFEATLFAAARGAGHSSFDRNMQTKEVCALFFASAVWRLRASHNVIDILHSLLHTILINRQANEKLDASISAFLRLMSPHFLHGAAHKVLEFFIRRYQVHDNNVDALLECSLPYHETNYFARLVQLLKCASRYFSHTLTHSYVFSISNSRSLTLLTLSSTHHSQTSRKRAVGVSADCSARRRASFARHTRTEVLHRYFADHVSCRAGAPPGRVVGQGRCHGGPEICNRCVCRHHARGDGARVHLVIGRCIQRIRAYSGATPRQRTCVWRGTLCRISRGCVHAPGASLRVAATRRGSSARLVTGSGALFRRRGGKCIRIGETALVHGARAFVAAGCAQIDACMSQHLSHVSHILSLISQVSVCRSQGLTSLSRKTLTSLARCVNLVPALASLSSASSANMATSSVAAAAGGDIDTDAFLRVLVCSSIEHRMSGVVVGADGIETPSTISIASMLKSLVDHAPLSGESARSVGTALFRDFLSRASVRAAETERAAKSAKHASANGSSAVATAALPAAASVPLSAELVQAHERSTVALLRRLERRFSVHVDAALDAALRTTANANTAALPDGGAEKPRVRLLQLVNSIFDRTGHQVLEESGAFCRLPQVCRAIFFEFLKTWHQLTASFVSTSQAQRSSSRWSTRRHRCAPPRSIAWLCF